MNITNEQLITVLSQFNPWWRGEAIADLPTWQRASFPELLKWVLNPPAPRAVLLSGARQIGKTTLLRQAIQHLLNNGVAAANILYATFDHPMIKMAGIDAVIAAWYEREPRTGNVEYLFLDEAHTIRDLGTWVKHQVDFNKQRRIVFTGSAIPLISSNQESGVGRWHTIRLTTLSFYEYIQLKAYIDKTHTVDFQKMVLEYIKSTNLDTDFNAFKIKSAQDTELLPKLPAVKSLRELFDWSSAEFYRVAELAQPYIGQFNDYLIRGGFPQTVRIKSITEAQRLIREDIIDRVLKRDMTALFGVRHPFELEKTFLYLCAHDGDLLDMQNLCQNLEVKRPTAQRFIELLEASHLIYRLQVFGYGTEVLRGKDKIYLADAAIASAVLLRGNTLLDNPTALGIATETAVFKHLYARYYAQQIRFSYWHGKKQHEVDLIAEIDRQVIPFEVKYRMQNTGVNHLTGLMQFCQEKKVPYAYVITKSLHDFGLLDTPHLPHTRVMKIPALLLCYWMGRSELLQTID